MTDSQLSVLPLPAALGVDSNFIAQQPQQLRIKPTTAQGWGLITDTFGRETVSAKYVKGKVDFSLPGQSNLLYCLRPKDNGFKRFFKEKHTYILSDSRGVDIAIFNPVDPGRVKNIALRYYEIDCTNSLAKGEMTRLTLRGSLWSAECALLWGVNPVLRIHRPKWISTNLTQHLSMPNNSDATYDAAVAPGADIVWISTILWSLDFLYAAATN